MCCLTRTVLTGAVLDMGCKCTENWPGGGDASLPQPQAPAKRKAWLKLATSQGGFWWQPSSLHSGGRCPYENRQGLGAVSLWEVDSCNAAKPLPRSTTAILRYMEDTHYSTGTGYSSVYQRLWVQLLEAEAASVAQIHGEISHTCNFAEVWHSSMY